MAIKYINSRVIHKHDTEINWNNNSNFVPAQAEVIIYDKDENYDYERIKIGDGETPVNNLPFISNNVLQEAKDYVDEKVSPFNSVLLYTP